MKLVCPREELARGLQTVLRSVGARAGIPALSGVLMELGDEDLQLTTTDLELTTHVRVPITGESGKIVVPARLLADIVRNLPAEDVELVVENGTVRVSGGPSKFNLRTLAAEDFPKVDPPADTRQLRIAGDVLARALSQISASASRDETRPVLTGVLFEGEGDELRLVATDSYRLAVRSLEVDGADGVKFLVHARAVVEVARLAAECEEVAIDVASSQVGFSLGAVTIQSRLIDGEFPAYKQLLPDDLPNRLTVPKEQFIASLKRVAVLAQDATPVFLEADPAGSRLTCQSQGVGDASEDIEGAYSGDPIRVAFNAQYLEAGAAACGSDDVLLDLSEAQRPGLIHGSDEESFRYLLMPIRVS